MKKIIVCMIIAFAVVGIVVMAVRTMIKAGSDNINSEKEELFVALDYHDVARRNIHLPYAYEMKGERNTLKVNLDNVESAYPQNSRVFVVVHGTARLTGDESGREKACCEVLLKYSAMIVAREGKLLVRDRLLEKFDAYSNDLNIGSIMGTKKMECWRGFQTVLKNWECSFAVPFETRESVQLESNGLFVFEK